MHILCALYAHPLCIVCTSFVHTMHKVDWELLKTHNAFYIYEHPYAHPLCIVCTSFVHCMHILCALYAHPLCIVCTSFVHCMHI